MPIDENATLTGLLCGLSLEPDGSSLGVVQQADGTRATILLNRTQLVQLGPRILCQVRLRGMAVWDGWAGKLVSFGVEEILG